MKPLDETSMETWEQEDVGVADESQKWVILRRGGPTKNPPVIITLRQYNFYTLNLKFRAKYIAKYIANVFIWV